jgi:cytochrome bd-type quinol oxidase subunit 2
MILELTIGAGMAGAAYAFAKKKNASTGQSVAAAAVTGIGSFAATAVVSAIFLPVLLVGGPLALGYYFVKRSTPKALPPAP